MVESQNAEKSEMLSFLKVAVVTIVVTIFLYTYNPPPKQETVRIQFPEFSLLGPYNNTDYEVHDVYDQLIDIKDFTFIINPNVCAGTEAGLLLMIIVSSKPDHFKQRELIRRTWGRTYTSTKVVFLVGLSDSDKLMELIEFETTEFGDIVQGNFQDSYRNLTYKHVMGLKWVLHHCPQARYILKTDDDLVVNSHALRTFLVRELSPWGAKGLITCSVYRNAIVHRWASSKWMVRETEYAGKYYPNYCAGYSIIYSKDVIPKLLSQVQALPYFWIDDVQITGVAAEMQNISRTPLSGLILSKAKMKILTAYGPEYIDNFLIGPPQLSTDNVEQIWKAMPQ